MHIDEYSKNVNMSNRNTGSPQTMNISHIMSSKEIFTALLSRKQSCYQRKYHTSFIQTANVFYLGVLAGILCKTQ